MHNIKRLLNPKIILTGQNAIMSSIINILSIIHPSDFTVSTWLLLGATLQCVLVATLPRNLALLPPIALLVCRYARSYMVATGILPNPVYKEVTHGRQTWQIPSADSTPAKTGSTDSIVVLVLAASVTHPNGRFSPGSKEMGTYFGKMWADAETNREKYGFLGNTPAMVTEDNGSRQDSKGTNMVYLSYWKTLEGLHKFAHGSVHMQGQLWWEKGAMETYKHLGVMHEVYEVPAGNWENVFHSFRPFGICKYRVKNLGWCFTNITQQTQNTQCLPRTTILLTTSQKNQLIG
jgi:hypothetical protein